MSDLSVSASVVIDAPPEKVWDVLVNPEKILEYIGTNAITDWKVGSTILWEGEFAEMQFTDKGKVLENDYPKLLRFEYWSSVGGYDDIPENYSVITYTIETVNNKKTKLTYERINIPTKDEQEMFETHIDYMLGEMKMIAER